MPFYVKCPVVVVLLDITAAINTVDHAVLCGHISTTMLAYLVSTKWFTFYFTETFCHDCHSLVLLPLVVCHKAPIGSIIARHFVFLVMQTTYIFICLWSQESVLYLINWERIIWSSTTIYFHGLLSLLVLLSSLVHSFFLRMFHTAELATPTVFAMSLMGLFWFFSLMISAGYVNNLTIQFNFDSLVTIRFSIHFLIISRT